MSSDKYEREIMSFKAKTSKHLYATDLQADTHVVYQNEWVYLNQRYVRYTVMQFYEYETEDAFSLFSLIHRLNKHGYIGSSEASSVDLCTIYNLTRIIPAWTPFFSMSHQFNFLQLSWDFEEKAV